MDQALNEREKYGRDALPIAGGQSLLVLLRNRMIDPPMLIDLQSLPELQGIKPNDQGISIGAMTTIHNLSASSDIRGTVPVLAQGASKVGSTAIRNLGTIGGNLCHNEPGADLPPPLLALNAAVELRSRKGIRKVLLREFFRNYFETVVAPEELLCGVEVPNLPAGASGAYLKHAITSEDLAIVGVAAVVVPQEKRTGAVREVRIAVGGASPVPFKASKAESVLKGAMLSDEAIREAAEAAAAEADPMTDPHASADYRTKMIKVLVRRAIAAAMERSERSGNGKAQARN
jgi:carbon-monoxide dehydrogenase medium subunit